jgi:hypothetical protein
VRTSLTSAAFVVALSALAVTAFPADADAQSRGRSGSAVRQPVSPGPVVTRGPAVPRAPAGRYYAPAGRYYPGGRYYYPAGGYYPYYGYPYRSAFYFSGAFGYPYWYGWPGFGFSWGYPYNSWSFGIGFGGAWGYPYRPYGYYGPYWYPPYPYGYGYWDDQTASARIDAQPVEAEVYVDGYRAGLVDDFDGVLQRLRMRPGEHEITLYLDGYRTVRQQLYFNSGSTKTIRLDMDQLGPGETADRPPAPVERAEREMPRDPPPQRPYDRDPEPRTQIVPTVHFGTLSLRIQPADAEILIDGERWTTTPGDSRIAIQLSPGRHKLEIRKDGFERYSEEIGIREGATFTLNISLKKG